MKKNNKKSVEVEVTAATTEATEAQNPATTEATEAQNPATTEATEAQNPATTEATEAQNPAKTVKKSTLKQSRWVKVHEQGQGNFEAKDNVMDITIGDNSYQAEITYKTSLVRNFNKAVYWFLRGLTNARADVVAQLAADELTAQAANASKETEVIGASGEGWSCDIINMGEGVFKATMRWTQEATEQNQSKNEGTTEVA